MSDDFCFLFCCRSLVLLLPLLLFLQHLPTLAPYLAIVINLTSVELVLDLL